MVAEAIEKSRLIPYSVNQIPELDRVLRQINSVNAITVSLFTIPLNIIPTYITNKNCDIWMRAEFHRCLMRQARAQDMNRACEAASTAGLYTYIGLYAYIMLYYT
jgi:hypothetical protein